MYSALTTRANYDLPLDFPVTTQYHILFGFLLLLPAFTFFLLYIIVVILLHAPEFRSVRSYQIVAQVGYLDITQLFGHSVLGIVMIFEITMEYHWNKIMGLCFTYGWYCLIMISTYLTLNRFISIVISPVVAANLYLTVVAIGLIYAVSLVLTSFEIFYPIFFLYDPTIYAYLYEAVPDNYTYPVSADDVNFISNFILVIDTGSTIVVFGAIGLYIRKRKSLSRNELILTLHIFVIGFLSIVDYVYVQYVYLLFEDSPWSTFMTQWIWMLYNGIKPVIYLATNKRLRTLFRSIFVRSRRKKRLLPIFLTSGHITTILTTY